MHTSLFYKDTIVNTYITKINLMDRLKGHVAVASICIEALDFWRLSWRILLIHQTSGSKEKKKIHTYKYGEKQQNKTKYSKQVCHSVVACGNAYEMTALLC